MTEPQRPVPPSAAIEPVFLLRQARALSGGPPTLVGPRSDEELSRLLGMLPPPTDADLRRAVSAAYYALLHTLTVRAARVLGRDYPPFEEYKLARKLPHHELRRVVDWILDDSAQPPPAFVPRVIGLRADQQAQLVASALRILWGARTEADYDHFASFSVSRVWPLIDRASEAVNIAESEPFAASDAGSAFYELLASRIRT